MSDNNGWLKLHRKFLDWEWYNDLVVKSVFIHLLLTSNHEEKSWHGTLVKRGEKVIGLSSFAESIGVSVQQLRTALKKLEKTGEISRKSTNKFTIVKVCKYDDYQQVETNQKQTNNKPITNEQQSNNNKQEYKNERIKESKNNIDTSTARTFVRPTIEEVKKYIQENRLTVDAVEFYAYYEANGWMCGRKPMQKWKACLISWQKKRNKQKQEQPTTSTIDYSDEAYRARMAKYEASPTAINFDEYQKRKQG